MKKVRKVIIVLLLIIGFAVLYANGQGDDTSAAGVDEQVIITALCNANSTKVPEPDAMPAFQRWYEETGIKIEWELVRSDWPTRKNLVLASGDVPDTFWGNKTITIADLTTNKDIFVELDDYIEGSTNIKKMFTEEPDLKDLVSFPDGSIYSLPHRMPLRPDTFQGNYINQTWLDNLGLDMPTTLDEFEQVLIAFKTGDPNGNGKADEIPWSWSGSGPSFGVWWIFGSFGMANNVFDRFALVDDEPVYIPVTGNYKDAIKWLNKLYAQGLIDMEVFTQDWGMWAGKCQQADPTIMGIAGMWTTNTLMGNENAVNYSTMPPLAGYTNEPKYPSNKTQLRSSPVTWTMTTAAQNPQAAFDFIDYIYAPEQSVQLYFGSYGGPGLKKEADGTITILGPEDSDVTYDTHIWEVGFGDMGPYYISKQFEKMITPNAWVLEKADIDAVYQPYIEESSYPSLIFNDADNEELATLKTDIENLLNEKMAAWITGEADIDEEWDKYLENMNSIGLQRFMDIHKARYNNR